MTKIFLSCAVPPYQFFFDGTGNAVQSTISNENKEFKQFQEKG
jgi:hypothetical protein